MASGSYYISLTGSLIVTCLRKVAAGLSQAPPTCLRCVISKFILSMVKTSYFVFGPFLHGRIASFKHTQPLSSVRKVS